MRRLLTLAAVSLLTLSLTAAAQGNPQIREGFTISFGLGGGSTGLTCDGCESHRETGPALYLLVGGAVSPSLILAAETHGWAKEVSGERMQSGFLMGVAQWYPAPENGFFVKGGLGFGQASDEISDPTFGNLKLESNGFGYQIGTGYDFRVGRNFSLSPYVNYMGTSGAKAKLNGATSSERLDVNMLSYGLGFTWH